MKISIVTPTFQRTTYLNQTIASVVSQAGEFELEYIIQDGGSGEDLIKILESWENKLSSGSFKPACKKLTFKWFSEVDKGMYTAINRGFDRCTGDIMAWINSDDLYHPGALDTVARIFEHFVDVHWISGIPNSFNAAGARVGFDSFPQAYSQVFIEKGYYQLNFLPFGFNWIAQDCCFWRRSLWQNSGAALREDKKLAADFYLWEAFSRLTDLVKCQTFTGGYRLHGEQFTAEPEKYRAELPDTENPPFSLKLLNTFFRCFPTMRPLIFNKYKGFPWIGLLNLKFEDLTGRVIYWDFESSSWRISLRSIF